MRALRGDFQASDVVIELRPHEWVDISRAIDIFSVLLLMLTFAYSL